MLRVFLSLNLFLILFSPSLSFAVTTQELEKEIAEFAEVEPGFLYRGVQPDTADLKLLKAFGIRTLINFRHEPQDIEWERKAAETMGFRYVSLPWRIQVHPKDPVMDRFLEEVGRKENGPFFMHCRRGAERTGVADAIYRRYVQRLSAEESWDRAMKGFNTRFYWRPFIWQRWQDYLKKMEPARAKPE